MITYNNCTAKLWGTHNTSPVEQDINFKFRDCLLENQPAAKKWAKWAKKVSVFEIPELYRKRLSIGQIQNFPNNGRKIGYSQHIRHLKTNSINWHFHYIHGKAIDKNDIMSKCKECMPQEFINVIFRITYSTTDTNSEFQSRLTLNIAKCICAVHWIRLSTCK